MTSPPGMRAADARASREPVLEPSPCRGEGRIGGGGPDAPAVLSVCNARKVYAGGVTALDDVSLTIRAGELLAIVGRSGSGKSTLLNIMGTLDRPTSGTVRIGGRDAARLSDRELSALHGRRPAPCATRPWWRRCSRSPRAGPTGRPCSRTTASGGGPDPPRQ
ncbi:ATP-binding cassette domain-containing protein [Streptomyces sp. SID2888]|nr:ATP-binding cassette domain-containing protein [Streptomyces sp. SID2888]